MWVYGLFIGFYSAMMGVGGGAVSTLVLSLYGQPIHAAVGISAGVGVVISIIGTIGFVIAGLPYQALMPPLSIGYVSLIGLALMGPVSAFFAPYGARTCACDVAAQARNSRSASSCGSWRSGLSSACFHGARRNGTWNGLAAHRALARRHERSAAFRSRGVQGQAHLCDARGRRQDREFQVRVRTSRN